MDFPDFEINVGIQSFIKIGKQFTNSEFNGVILFRMYKLEFLV